MLKKLIYITALIIIILAIIILKGELELIHIILFTIGLIFFGTNLFKELKGRK